MIRAAASVLLLASLLACASETSAPSPPSALRQQGWAAAEAGAARFAGRHYAAAAEAFGRAAEIFGALDDPAAEATALRNRAEALRRAGRTDEAVVGFERALVLDREGGRQAAEARDLAGLARCLEARGDTDAAIAQAEAALALDAGSDASLEIDLAVYLIARGRPADEARVVALLTSAAERAAAQDEPRTEAAAHLHLGRAYLGLGSPGLAEEPLRRALEEFRALDAPEGLARTHEALYALLEARGDGAAARRHLEQARRGYAFLADETALARVDALLGAGRD